MIANRYQVIYQGEFREGFDRGAVLKQAAKILSISEDQAGKVLNGRRVVLRKGLDEASAREQCIRLKKAGLKVALGVPQPGTATPPAGPPMPRAAAPAPPPRPNPAAGAGPSAPPPSPHPPDKSARPVTTRVPFEFTGTGSEYFRIWIVNILLSIVTLGVYSAWAKVRRKQYFYGNTVVVDTAFDYLGDPLKILKGRLIVGGAIVAAGAATFFFPLLQFAFTLALAALSPWLIVRSLMFNARNSAWRNIRFGFKGTPWEAIKAYALWPALALVTLGLLSPYVYYRQRRFLVANSSYGRTPFEFAATWRDYYRILMIASLAGVLGVAVLAGAALVWAPLAVLAVPIYFYLYAYTAVKTGNVLYNSSRLGRHRLESSMQVGSYLMLVVTNTLATALTCGFFHPWAKVRAIRYRTDHLALVASGDLDAFVADEQKSVGAVGDASGDFFDFDLGI
jgi:uncharacterized membrane protein YjgN (DUF898 family)